GWAREIRCADTESGEVHWYAVTADTHFLASGATQVVGTLRDVTQAKLAAAGQA
ncbi:MAG: hypothetical protein HKO07_05295, partial [Pseudomonadales bacterium]|nr:hypothetical protein [Pseudomonadales bacterium]